MAGLALLTGLSGNCSLTHLDLSGCFLSDASTVHLASILEQNPSVQSLNLCRNNIGSAGGRELARGLAVAASNPEGQLRFIALDENPLGQVGCVTGGGC